MFDLFRFCRSGNIEIFGVFSRVRDPGRRPLLVGGVAMGTEGFHHVQRIWIDLIDLQAMFFEGVGFLT